MLRTPIFQRPKYKKVRKLREKISSKLIINTNYVFVKRVTYIE
jgi:hypothetical protein